MAATTKTPRVQAWCYEWAKTHIRSKAERVEFISRTLWSAEARDKYERGFRAYGLRYFVGAEPVELPEDTGDMEWESIELDSKTDDYGNVLNPGVGYLLFVKLSHPGMFNNWMEEHAIQQHDRYWLEVALLTERAQSFAADGYDAVDVILYNCDPPPSTSTEAYECLYVSNARKVIIFRKDLTARDQKRQPIDTHENPFDALADLGDDE